MTPKSPKTRNTPKASSSSSRTPDKSPAAVLPPTTTTTTTDTPRTTRRQRAASRDHDEEVVDATPAATAATTTPTRASTRARASTKETTPVVGSSKKKKTKESSSKKKMLSHCDTEDDTNVQETDLTTTATSTTTSTAIMVATPNHYGAETERKSSSSKKKKKSASNEDATTPDGVVKQSTAKKGLSSSRKRDMTPRAGDTNEEMQVDQTLHEKKSTSKKSKRSPKTTPERSHETTSMDDDDEALLVVKKMGDIPSASSPQHPIKPAPTVEVTVHRIRHLDYHPKPILCIAASTASSASSTTNGSSATAAHAESSSSSWMAVSRESGSIELQTVHPKLRTVAVVAGQADAPLTALAWATTTTATTVVPESSSSSIGSSNNGPQHVLIGANRSDLYVVDFWGTSQLVAKTPCAGGGIFCLIGLGGGGGGRGSDLIAAGCQDGSIRIFRVLLTVAPTPTEDGTSAAAAGNNHHYQLQSVSTVPSAGSAVLSLASRTSKTTGGDGMMVGTVLFAGIADGTIRRYDCFAANTKNSRGAKSAVDSTSTFFAAAGGVLWKSTLRMTVECYGRSTPTRVWALKAASDGTIVSGDSLGHVQFWDGDTGTLMSSFEQNDSKADVLALDMCADESKVFASGVDSRVVCIERSVGTDDTNNSDSSKWIMTHAQRPHTHDVKAVTIVKKFKIGPNGQVSKETEILCTGGIDTKLCTYHVSEFGLRRPRALYPWPSLKSPIAAASEGRLLTMLREDRVDLYELAPTPEEPTQMMAPILVPDEDSLIGTVQVKGSSNLACSAVSSSGEFLALSDSYALLLFHLRIETASDGARRVVPSKIPVKVPGATSVVSMRFVQDSCLVLAMSNGRVHVISLAPCDESTMIVEDESGFQATVVQTLSPSIKNVDNRPLLLSVHSVFGTKDGTWFATARNSSGHGDGKIDVYRRTSAGGDTYQYWWSVPSIGNAVTAAAFLNNVTTPLMAVASVNYALYVFDVSERRLGKWSERAGFPLTTKVPTDLAARNDYPVRIGTNPASPSLVTMGSFGAIVAINTDEEFPQQCRIFPETHVRGTKRKRSQSVTEHRDGDQPSGKSSTCTMCLRYNSMLFMDFVADHELVVVEQPWLNVVATFPDALHRRVYGT